MSKTLTRLNRNNYGLSVDSPWWLGSREVSVLDSSAEGPASNRRRDASCLVTYRQTVRTHRASVRQAAKLVAALLRVARV